MPDKSKYQSVPDAELGADVEDVEPSTKSKEEARAKYGVEGEQEVELLAMLDGASNLKPSFDFPAVNPDELASQGKSYVWSLIAPTVSVVCTMAIAWLLNVTAQGDAWISNLSNNILIPIFPYFNAVVVFLGSFLPMQQRFMDSIDPVFGKIDSVQAGAERNVDTMADKVDATVDKIQAKVHKVLEPYLPKLAMATKMETMVKKVKPDIDIPDPSDLDREFDQAQGMVGQKLNAAKENINIQSILPTVFQSSTAFFWRIVVPFGMIALAIQLIVVALEPTAPTTTTLSTSPNNPLGDVSTGLQDQSSDLQSHIHDLQSQADSAAGAVRKLRDLFDEATNLVDDTFAQHSSHLRSRQLVEVEKLQDDAAAAAATTTTADAATSSTMADARDTVASYRDDAVSNMEAGVQDTMANQTDTTVDYIRAQVQDTAVAANAAMDDGRKQASAAAADATAEINAFQDETVAQANAAMDDMKHQANDAVANANATYTALRGQAQDTLTNYTSQAQDQIDEAKSQIRPMITSIVISYLIALLQLAVAYILSGDKVKTFCINLALKLAKGQVDKALEESGVPKTIDEVLVVRMERIRDKLLRILKVAGELDEILDKIPGAGAGMDKAGDALGKVGSKLGGKFKTFGKK